MLVSTGLQFAQFLVCCSSTHGAHVPHGIGATVTINVTCNNPRACLHMDSCYSRAENHSHDQHTNVENSRRTAMSLRV